MHSEQSSEQQRAKPPQWLLLESLNYRESSERERERRDIKRQSISRTNELEHCQCVVFCSSTSLMLDNNLYPTDHLNKTRWAGERERDDGHTVVADVPFFFLWIFHYISLCSDCVFIIELMKETQLRIGNYLTRGARASERLQSGVEEEEMMAARYNCVSWETTTRPMRI